MMKIWMFRAPADEGGGEGAPPVESTTPQTPPEVPVTQPPPPPYEQMLGELNVSEELRAYGAKIGGLDKLLNHAYNQESLIGRKGVLVPGKTHEEDPQGWAKFYSELGRPESPENYQIPELPEAIKDAGVDPDFEQWARQTLYKYGLDQRAFAGIFSDYIEMAEGIRSTTVKGGEEAQKAAKERLNVTYGGRADEVLSDIKAMRERYGGAKVIAAIEAAGLDLDPDYVNSEYTLAKRLKESGLHGSMSGGVQNVVSREQAQSRIAEIKNTPSLKRVMVDRNDPGHAELKKEFDNMMKVIYPPEQEGGAVSPEGNLVFNVTAS